MTLDDLIASENSYDQIDSLVDTDPLELRDLLVKAVARLSSGQGGMA